ncbi:Abc transporter b family member [Thalictrum thalictroides]|uniref:Abc transporter b family member n=1 Tax=Thalictrum thalictroides TaxID=46969 RepID=A0A7J6WBP4_THATH|nr:Abc transporter b family member [Thalictrum thalictroides]
MSIFQLFRFADGVDKLFLLFGTLGSIGDGVMSPLTMWVLSGAINEYGTNGISFTNAVVDKYSLRILYVAIGVGISAFVEGICWTRTAERQASRIKKEYLKSVLRQEVGFFDAQTDTLTTFEVVSTVSSGAHSIQDVISEKIPNCVAQLAAFSFSLMVSFVLSWRLALFALPFSLMFIIPGVGFGKVMMKLGIKMKDAYGIAGGIAEQAVSSVRTVYSYVGERQTLERFSDGLQQSMKLGIKQGFTKGMLIGSMGMTFVTFAFQSWVGSILVVEKGEKGGTVFVAGVCIVLGGLSIMSALPNLSYFSEAVATASRIYKMIDRLPAIDSENAEREVVLTNIAGDLQFKNVTFSYPSRPDTPILQEFNLKVGAGKTVGLVGGSGSGKSTTISLLERFYDPVKGKIFLDGTDIKKLRLKWLRSQMGLVNQEPILFATSIKENILFGNEEAPMDLVVKAAKDANAHDFITNLPKGYETQVGQFGVQLSGGQKQRIAIARALIRDPKILLLDEATSALDAESERTVQEALDKASLGRTTIVIAHRLSTIRKANFIVVLQSGKVIESGTHDELIQANNQEGGVYSKMVQLQQKTMQTEALYPSYSPTEFNLSKINLPNSISVPSSRLNSPAFYLSPASYSIIPVDHISPAPYSITHSHSSYENEEQNLKLSSNAPSPQWRLLMMNRREWKRTLLGCLGAIGFGAVQPMHAYCLGSIASVYFLPDDSHIKSETKFYCFIFLAIAGISFIMNLLQHYNFAIMGERLTKRVREKMLAKVLTFEIGWFDRDENTSAAICARLATEANMARSLIGDRMSLLVQVFVCASLSWTLGLLVTWRLGSVMIAMQPFIIGCFYSRSVFMKSMSAKARTAQNDGSQLACEAVVNHRTVTAFSSQKRIVHLFEATFKGPQKENIKQSWFAGVALCSSQFITTASIALAYWYGGRLMTQGKITAKALFQAFFILMSTGKSIADAGSMTSDLAKGVDAIRSVFAILDRNSEIEPDHAEGIKVDKKIKGLVELKNLFFSYPARPEQMIFNGLSLQIEAGKKMALVGQSGSGKSTIIGLIERFYDPLKGLVVIDGHDIRSYNLRQLRSQIALVSQEPTLFAGTIRENITYGQENVTEEELRKSAMRANAHEFISSMKNGYETYCGERGVQLSGGQKQRIALARAILKNPAILLLDEATSALDSLSESLVQGALDKMMIGRTCVVVAHRLSTIQKADSIAVIKNGKVVEEGSHSSLLAIGRGGAYYSLIKLQGNNSPYR